MQTKAMTSVILPKKNGKISEFVNQGVQEL
jgi:hypothetical protein